jgi:LysM repeat protein
MPKTFAHSPKRTISIGAAALVLMLLALFAAAAPISGADCTLTHHLRSGDSLSILARYHNTTVTAILALNPQITNPNDIEWGTDICLSDTARPVPFTRTYVVQPGDSLASIAIKFGTTITELVRANGIGNPNVIFTGETLTVPAAEATEEPVFEVTPAVEATVEVTEEAAG